MSYKDITVDGATSTNSNSALCGVDGSFASVIMERITMLNSSIGGMIKHLSQRDYTLTNVAITDSSFLNCMYPH
jgi:hypothetical protein